MALLASLTVFGAMPVTAAAADTTDTTVDEPTDGIEPTDGDDPTAADDTLGAPPDAGAPPASADTSDGATPPAEPAPLASDDGAADAPEEATNSDVPPVPDLADTSGTTRIASPFAFLTSTVNDETEYRSALAAMSADGSGSHTLTLGASFTITDPGGDGDPIYSGTRPLTIDGAGFTIDANNTTRGLRQIGTATVTVDDLTIINGTDGGDDNGGAALRADADLVITDSTFTDNISSGTWDGGAVRSSGGVTVSGSNFTDNSSVDNDGGAIDADDFIYLTGSTFTRNTALNGEGGAVDCSCNDPGTPFQVIDSTFTDNEADSGGALSSEESISITGSTFSGNEAVSDDGGAAESSENITTENSTFTGNVALEDGGALDIGGEYADTGSTFTDNSSGFEGGAVWVDEATELTDTSFDGNASGYGGAVYVDSGILTATGVDADDNESTDDGGAFYVYDDDVTITDSAFDGNHSDTDGGAVFGWYDIDVSSSIFTDNSSDDDGGAVYSYDGEITLTDSTFTGNTGDEGGAVCAEEYDITVLRSTFIDNEATGGSGGGIWGELDVVVTDSTFTDNDAYEYGGGIYSDEGDGAVDSSRFTGGTAEYAGAINIENGALTVDDSYFEGHSAEDDGGAIWTDDDLTINRSTFIDNESTDEYGGAAHTERDLIATESVFTDNYAEVDGGALNSDGGMIISGSTFTDNEAGDDGGAANSEGVTVISGSTFTDNTAGDGGGAFDGGGDPSALTITGSTFSGNVANSGEGSATSSDTDTTITNSTFSANVVTDDLGDGLGGTVLVHDGVLSLRFVTMVDNSGVGGATGVTMPAGTLSAIGSVITSADGAPCDLADSDATDSSWSYASTDDSCGFDGIGDHQGAVAASFDALADNGGATATRMPSAGSVVRGAILAAACADLTGDLTTDQRGAARPSIAGARCDIGAVNTAAVTPSAPASVVITPDGNGETATLSWSTPENDGGADVLGFYVHYSLDGLTFAPMTDTAGLATDPDARSVTVPMPPPGLAIHYRVGAINVVGTGVAGVSVTADAPESSEDVPGTPSALAVTGNEGRSLAETGLQMVTLGLLMVALVEHRKRRTTRS